MSSVPIAASVDSGRTWRRFTLLDAMVLIAAVSLGLMVPRVFESVTQVGDAITNLMLASDRNFTIPAAWMLIASATLALLVILSPRACGPERFRRPGALAMFLVVLTWGYFVLQAIIGEARFLINHGQVTFHWEMSLIFSPVQSMAPQVILPIGASWITLGWLGERKSGRDWLDRSGCLLGWVWVLWGIFSKFLTTWY